MPCWLVPCFPLLRSICIWSIKIQHLFKIKTIGYGWKLLEDGEALHGLQFRKRRRRVDLHDVVGALLLHQPHHFRTHDCDGVLMFISSARHDNLRHSIPDTLAAPSTISAVKLPVWLSSFFYIWFILFPYSNFVARYVCSVRIEYIAFAYVGKN